jgi:aryl sulfotransferase
MNSITPPLYKVHNHHMDSTRWNDFNYREGDVVIATWAKSGTTWVQTIALQLLYGGVEGLDVATLSPWIDFRIAPKDKVIAGVDAQKGRRVVKTHLPKDAVPFSQDAKYVFVGRDGRDAIKSFHRHFLEGNDELYTALNGPGLVGPPIERPPASFRQYFIEWLEGDGFPFWPFWENVRSWWNSRDMPNVYMAHYNNFLEDMGREARLLAEFLNMPADEQTIQKILDYCSFDSMRKHADLYAPLKGSIWKGGGQTFFYKGTNGRWREELMPEDVERYEQTARQELGEECAQWLENGGFYKKN